MFAKIGEQIPPCGVPLYVMWYCQSSQYPAFSSFQISLMSRASLILLLIMPTKAEWSMLSKQPLMSPSTNQRMPLKPFLIDFRAVWQLRLGRNPWEQSRNTGSYTASSIIRRTSCTSLSVKVGIPKGRIFPVAFWI